MGRYKEIWKLKFMLLLVIVAILSFSTSTSAAGKLPYEYTLNETTNTFNGFKGVKEMVITFDESIPANFDDREIKLYQGSNEINHIIKDKNKGTNTLTITFDNLQYLNTTDSTKQDYQVVIGKKANVIPAQTQDIILPFKLYEILPGFKSIFIDSTADDINKNIFKYSAPRDVQIHVPKAYITQIETIHRYQGVTTSNNEPSLTNIDVLTDVDTARMKAWIGTSYQATDNNSRDLDYRSDLKGFSMGQAGIVALVCEDKSEPCKVINDDFHLVAYDQYGKRLTQRSFKIKVNNKEKDFIINDYIPKPDAVFGKTVNLYDLMADVKLVTAITEHIPVSQFNKLGVTYALSNTQSVTNLDQLNLALANPDIKTINLISSITGDVNIPRSVTLKGNSIDGDVTLGDGTEDLTIRLDDLTINGELTIDVGANGTVILNKSSAQNTNIITGGVNSIYLFDSEPGPIEFNNSTPVRIVNNYSNGTSKDLSIQLNSSQPVTLEGLAGTLTVDVVGNTSAQLTVVNPVPGVGAAIAQGTAQPQGTLSLKVSDLVELPSTLPTNWSTEILSSIIEDGKQVREITLTPLTKTADEWENGVDLDKLTELGLANLLTATSPTVSGATISISGIKLTINGTIANEVIELKGEKDNVIYKIKITVTVGDN